MDALPSPRRAWRMVQRSLLVYRHTWMVIVSGFFEPLFYLLSIGLGVGMLVRQVEGIPYAAFVAPGLLASSCMQGAITDGFFNTFFKLHFQKTYDGIMATPMRLIDIVFGELLWTVVRGSLYAAGFLGVLVIVGRVSGSPLLLAPGAWLALPAAVLVAASFSAIALAAACFARRIEDFDLVIGLGVMPSFLFSGIFFPVTTLPEWLQWVVFVSPLYHAVEVLRALTTGAGGSAVIANVVYLAVVGGVAFAVAARRLERSLVR